MPKPDPQARCRAMRTTRRPPGVLLEAPSLRPSRTPTPEVRLGVAVLVILISLAAVIVQSARIIVLIREQVRLEALIRQHPRIPEVLTTVSPPLPPTGKSETLFEEAP